MVIDNCDEIAFPTEPTRVHTTEKVRPQSYRSVTWSESTNAKRRRRYRMARIAGHTTEEAMAMSQGKDWF
jgi:hypothetical protein